MEIIRVRSSWGSAPGAHGRRVGLGRVTSARARASWARRSLPPPRARSLGSDTPKPRGLVHHLMKASSARCWGRCRGSLLVHKLAVGPRQDTAQLSGHGLEGLSGPPLRRDRDEPRGTRRGCVLMPSLGHALCWALKICDLGNTLARQITSSPLYTRGHSHNLAGLRGTGRGQSRCVGRLASQPLPQAAGLACSIETVPSLPQPGYCASTVCRLSVTVLHFPSPED